MTEEREGKGGVKKGGLPTTSARGVKNQTVNKMTSCQCCHDKHGGRFSWNLESCWTDFSALFVVGVSFPVGKEDRDREGVTDG